jgi:hypothetical protein
MHDQIRQIARTINMERKQKGSLSKKIATGEKVIATEKLFSEILRLKLTQEQIAEQAGKLPTTTKMMMSSSPIIKSKAKNIYEVLLHHGSKEAFDELFTAKTA